MFVTLLTCGLAATHFVGAPPAADPQPDLLWASGALSSVGLDYRGFRNAGGAGWVNRVRLVSLPACALTTPARAACQVQTPLASHNDATGEDIAWERIKQKLLDLIDKEDKTNPLSDEELVERLEKEGFPIKRRTVTKYRKMLNIPSSRQRKDWSLVAAASTTTNGHHANEPGGSATREEIAPVADAPGSPTGGRPYAPGVVAASSTKRSREPAT